MIAALVARTGLSPLAVKLLAGIALAAALALAIVLLRADAYADGQRAIETQIARANAAQLRIDAAAKELAAKQRRIDDALIDAQHKDLIDAIARMPDTRPDALRIAAACARLRASGRGAASVPIECGSASGAGTRAPR